MATAPPPTTRPRQARRAPTPPAPRWRRWLLLGVLFGLGYGLTQRLLEVRWGEGAPKAPAFKPTSTPSGTTLEELRGQHGEKAKPLTADLEELARKQREEKEKERKQEEEPPTDQGSEPQEVPPTETQPPSGTAQSPAFESSPGAPPVLPPPPLPVAPPNPPAPQTPGEAPATLP